MMGLIDRLEFAPGGPAARAVQWWPLVPMLCVLTMIAAWWPRQRFAGVGGLVIALYVGGVALALKEAPVTVLVGPRLVLPASLVLIGASLMCLVRPTRRVGSTPA